MGSLILSQSGFRLEVWSFFNAGPASFLRLVLSLSQVQADVQRQKETLFVIFITFSCIIIGNLLLFLSYDLAPNLAYPAIISNTRMVYLYMLSIVFDKMKLDTFKLFGIIVIFIAISFLY